MIDHSRPSSHGPMTIAMHWLMALLFVAAFTLGQVMEEMPRGGAKLGVLGWHLLAGAAIFALIVPRLLSRLADGWRTHAEGPRWEQRAAKFVHAGLYGLMAGLPLTGLLAVATGRSAIPLWGDFKLQPLFTSKLLHGAMEETHEFLVSVLIAIVVVHVAGVLWHKFVLRDDVAGRMWPFGRG